MLRIVAVSTRGDRYLVDNPSVHPINPPGQYDSPVPDGVGAEFATLDEVQHYTQTELGYLSCYYQVFIVDRAGATVLRGWRTGRGGHRHRLGLESPVRTRGRGAHPTVIINIGDLFHPDRTHYANEGPHWTLSAEPLAEVMSLSDDAPFEVLRIHVRMTLFLRSPTNAEIDEAQNAPHMDFALIPGEHALILAHRFGDGLWADGSWEAGRQALSPGVPDPGTDHHIPVSVALVDSTTGILRAHRITTWPPQFAIAVRDAIATQLHAGAPADVRYTELRTWVNRYPEPAMLVDELASIIVRGGSNPRVLRSRRQP